jgi:hypothetical protein
MTNKIIEVLKKNVVSFNDHDVIFGGDGDLTDLANELEQAINYTRCSTQLKGKQPMTFAKWREFNGYTPYDNSSYQKDNKIINVDKLEISYRAYFKNF